MMENEIMIHLKSTQEIYVEFRENGVACIKNITIDDLLNCINKSTKVKHQFQTGLLPKRTVSMLWDMENNRRFIVIEYPEKVTDITYMETTYRNFPLPRILFGFTVESSGRIWEWKLEFRVWENFRQTLKCLHIHFRMSMDFICVLE